MGTKARLAKVLVSAVGVAVAGIIKRRLGLAPRDRTEVGLAAPPDDEPAAGPAPEPEPRQPGLTDRHLGRLAALALQADGELTAKRPELAGTLVAAVLAGPAAGAAPADAFGVWLFYARREGVTAVQTKRYREYDADLPEFPGRRVEVMLRNVAAEPGDDPAAAVRTWLAGRATSPRLLAQQPVVLLWPDEVRGEIAHRPPATR